MTIAGSKINMCRIKRSESSRIGIKPRTAITRPYTGYTIPNVYAMIYRYAEMGYTSAFEAAIPIIKARYIHEELEEIPIIDKGSPTLFGSNWMVMDAIRDNDQDQLAERSMSRAMHPTMWVLAIAARPAACAAARSRCSETPMILLASICAAARSLLRAMPVLCRGCPTRAARSSLRAILICLAVR